MSKNSKRMNRSRRGGDRVIHPKVIHPEISFFRTVRYVANAAGNILVSRANILNTLIVNTSNVATNYRLAESVRLVHIEHYSIATTSTGTAPTTISMEWLSEYGPARLVSDTSLGSATPSHYNSVPPRDSVASFWSVSGVNESTGLFFLAVNANDVIDVRFEIVLQDFGTHGSPTSYTSTANGTIGTMYTTPLDGASGKVVPVGVLALS